jgi:hypothetical protein
MTVRLARVRSHADLMTNMGTGLVLYRPLDQPTQFADFDIGFRAWNMQRMIWLTAQTAPA